MHFLRTSRALQLKKHKTFFLLHEMCVLGFCEPFLSVDGVFGSGVRSPRLGVCICDIEKTLKEFYHFQ
jgi:hypothetical protein